MRKRIVAAVMVIAFVFGSAYSFDAAGSDITITFNGQVLQYAGVGSRFINGDVFVPVCILEQLGFFDVFVHEVHIPRGYFNFNGVERYFGDYNTILDMANFTIDYMTFNVIGGMAEISVNYWAWISPADLMYLHGGHMEWPVEDYSHMGIYWRVVVGSSAQVPFMQENQRDAAAILSQLVPDARGFVEIPAIPAATMMIPLQPIADAAGFDVMVSANGRVINITRSAHPEFDADNNMTSLLDLASHSLFRLFWNSAERRLEVRVN